MCSSAICEVLPLAYVRDFFEITHVLCALLPNTTVLWCGVVHYRCSGRISGSRIAGIQRCKRFCHIEGVLTHRMLLLLGVRRQRVVADIEMSGSWFTRNGRSIHRLPCAATRPPRPIRVEGRLKSVEDVS